MNPTQLIRSGVMIIVAVVLASVVWHVTDTVITQAVSSDWPTANGFVRQSQVVASDANPFIDDLELEYTYQVGTQWIIGDRLTFFGRGLSMLLRVGSADEMAASYTSGTPIQVAYDPANPARGVLIPGITAVEFGAAALLILGVGGVSLGMFSHAIAALRRDWHERSVAAHPHAAPRSNRPDTSGQARAA